MIVADLMTRKPASVRSGQTLAAAAQIMWDCDCGAVPVIESEGDRAIGILTDRDICMATWSRGPPPSSISVDEVMSRDLVRCTPQESISRVAALMRSKQIRRIPVVDSDQRLVGILSLADIARATTNAPARRSDAELSSDGVATTLASICGTHPSPTKSAGASASA